MKPMETAAMVDVMRGYHVKDAGQCCKQTASIRLTKPRELAHLLICMRGWFFSVWWFVLSLDWCFRHQAGSLTDVANLAGAVGSDVVQGPKPMEVVILQGSEGVRG